MIAMSKPNHKFFERILDNDTDSLFDYLTQKAHDLVDGKIDSVPEEERLKYQFNMGPATQLGRYYNIFKFDHEGIHNLKKALGDIIDEACEYYSIPLTHKDYKIHGWFNLDFKTEQVPVSPIKNDHFYHDHMGGEGAPNFHGYYCVNAEPSITFYKINNEVDFENHNKNNRAIVSETGHPHGRDDWHNEKPRITIAYDIAPGNAPGVLGYWVDL